MGASFLRTSDDFDWDHHGSFQCSTPPTRVSRTLPEAGSLDYTRVFFEGSLCISALDSNVVDATTTTDVTLAADALQELDIIDTIIEAQFNEQNRRTGKNRL